MAKLAILTGDTFPFRDVLKTYWTWDKARKAWTLEVDADATEESVRRMYVRGLPGIRNRGDFTVAIEG